MNSSLFVIFRKIYIAYPCQSRPRLSRRTNESQTKTKPHHVLRSEGDVQTRVYRSDRPRLSVFPKGHKKAHHKHSLFVGTCLTRANLRLTPGPPDVYPAEGKYFYSFRGRPVGDMAAAIIMSLLSTFESRRDRLQTHVYAMYS